MHINVKMYIKYTFIYINIFIFRGVGEGQRQREKISSRLHVQCRAQHGA